MQLNTRIVLAAALLTALTSAWSSTPSTSFKKSSSDSFCLFAATFESYDGTKGINESMINQAAGFMIESFWGVDGGNPSLLSEQAADLTSRFGEIMGKKKLFSKLIVGRVDNQIAGIVGVEVALFDVKEENLLNYSQAEKILKDAISSLGPKERRQFKDTSIEELVLEVPSLVGNFEAVAVLANLCVSPSSRGTGLGLKLCTQVEEVVAEWGLKQIMLKVEEGNEPAKKLYEKIGYLEKCIVEDSTTLRPDLENNSFKEMPCTILTLSKGI
jgi:ribosomal protein S18 acetylase RimI-like enzyme